MKSYQNDLYQVFCFVSVFTVLAFAFIIVPKVTFLSLRQYQDTIAIFLSLTIIGLYFIVSLFKKNGKGISFSIYDGVFLSFIALLFTSALWARNSVYTYNIGFHWIFCYLIYKFFEHYTQNNLHKNFIISLLTLLFVISLSVVSLLFLINIDFSQGFTSILNSEQFTTIYKKNRLHRNYISSILALGSGIPIYWLIRSTTKRQFILCLFVLGWLTFMLMVIRSRGSLLAFFTILFLFYLLNFFKRFISRRKIISTLVIVIFAVISAFKLQADKVAYTMLLSPFYGIVSADGDGRLQMWDISLQLIAEKPWTGYGAGSWEFEYQKYGAGDLKQHNHSQYFYKHSHSYFIEILFWTGIIGLVFFVALIFLYPLLCILKKIKDANLDYSDGLFFSIILVFNICVLFYGNTYSIQITYHKHIVLLFAGIGLLSYRIKPARNKIAYVFPILLVMLCLFFYYKTYQNAQLVNHYHQNLRAKNYNQCEKILEQLSEQTIQLGFFKRGNRINALYTKLYKKQHKHNLVVQSTLKEIEEHPYNFNLWRDLGDTYFKLKQYMNAKHCYEQALLYNCDYVYASIGLKYLDSYINQYELNKKTWSRHKQLNHIYKTYKKFKKQINLI